MIRDDLDLDPEKSYGSNRICTRTALQPHT